MTDRTSPTSDLDETVHQRHRLGILTVAAEADGVEFGYLQDTLGLTPGNLNRHLAVLEDAKLVSIHKEFHGRKPKTWVKISKAGRAALAQEIAILTDLVQRHTRARPGTPTTQRADK
jgi:DNA-binding MarR family transcriptional regulator